MSKKKSQPPKIDKAFTDSDRHTLSDLKLQPWTPDRIIKAQELGMLFPNIGEHDWEQYRRTKVYPGAVKDVMIFVFLAQLEDDKLDSATFQAAKAFGIKRGLHMADSVPFWEAYSKFVEVNNEIQTVATRPKGSPGAGTEEDEDLEGNG